MDTAALHDFSYPYMMTITFVEADWSQPFLLLSPIAMMSTV